MLNVFSRKKFLPLLFLASIPLTAFVSAQEYVPPHKKPGPATDTIYFRSFHVDRAPQDLASGEMDLYYYNLKTAAARELASDPNIALYEAPASTLSLVLNPAPAPPNQLNPFSIPTVRYAMQFLVDRNFISNEIYQGLGHPMTTHVSPLDFDFLTIFDLVQEQNIQFEPDYARQLIDDAMETAGAEKINEIWHFAGQPIRIKFIIRTEDERREIGDLVRSQLNKIGFEVDARYQQFGPAIQTVYSSDPALLQWHIYTEGWGRSAPQRYDFANINGMTAPWLGNMPGWQEVGFWQYENAEIDAMGKKLFTGEFASLEERNKIYKDMTDLATSSSIRIWIANVMNNFAAEKQLNGVTLDLVSGPKALWTIREAFIPDQDTITIGNLWVWTDRTTWNPIGGFGDVYSSDIWAALHDPPITNHPATGIPMPLRAEYEVVTAGPSAKLDVPVDGMKWDVVTNKWRFIGDDIKATSKVTYDYSKYFQSKWHHDVPITMADVLYSIQQQFEIAFDQDKSRVEFALGVTSRPFLETFQGYRVIDDTKLEVYVDFWHFVDDQIASFANPSSLTTPWELLSIMDQIVFQDRKAAYSNTAAARFQVPWLSLAIRSDANLVKRSARESLREERFPEEIFTIGMQSYANLSDAKHRYQALLNWFDKYQMLVISNGPYMLTRYDPPAQFAELKAFRDESYPYKPGDWHHGTPEVISFSPMQDPFIPIGEETTLNIKMDGPGKLGLRYQIIDPSTGEILLASNASSQNNSDFRITLDNQFTSQLSPGTYQIFLAGFSDKIARLGERKLELEASLDAGEKQALNQQLAESTPTTSPNSTGGCAFASPKTQPAPIETTYLIGTISMVAFAMRRKRR
ncbi:MAG: hypothetical protein FI725_00540 [SAR202 cluster bacterium]|nr:hypothetical protein [SAR202 cluster bacterium]|tara:strand:+ start:4788 stop:7364 length:2577 start_codon:yes stop_codon:yes gene_type:complete